MIGRRAALETIARDQKSEHSGSDAELLDAFIARRDEAAFAERVHRHGPKVYAVCRRVLGRHQLPEDAYRATFLVLARKAHRVHPRSAVGGFLYGVARRAALHSYAVSRRGAKAHRPRPRCAGAPVVKGDGHPIHRITSFDPNGESAKMVQELKARPFDYMVSAFDWSLTRLRPFLDERLNVVQVRHTVKLNHRYD